MKFVTTDVETPVKAIFVSDFDFCQAMHHPPQSSTQSKKVEFSKRFEVEQKFLEEMVADIEKLIVSSGRMDVELKVVKAREVAKIHCKFFKCFKLIFQIFRKTIVHVQKSAWSGKFTRKKSMTISTIKPGLLASSCLIWK